MIFAQILGPKRWNSAICCPTRRSVDISQDGNSSGSAPLNRPRCGNRYPLVLLRTFQHVLEITHKYRLAQLTPHLSSSRLRWDKRLKASDLARVSKLPDSSDSVTGSASRFSSWRCSRGWTGCRYLHVSRHLNEASPPKALQHRLTFLGLCFTSNCWMKNDEVHLIWNDWFSYV